MIESLGQAPITEIDQASRNEDPEQAGKKKREAFDLSGEQQSSWSDAGAAFAGWRNRLEQQRILVFQADFPREEAQGFSLSGSQPYAIVVSRNDAASARSFTLFHELGHLLLREGGICLVEDGHAPNGSELAEIENWCDRFAEAFLIDADVLRGWPELESVRRREVGYEQRLHDLASFFRVSQQVVLFRLWHLDLVAGDWFWTEYRRVAAAAADAAVRPSKRTGGPSPVQRTIGERGRLFTRLVLEGLEREVLSYTDAIDYLGLRLKHLEQLQKMGGS